MKFLLVIAAVIAATSANLSAHEQWTSFKAEHGKVYNVNVDKVRFQIFQDNLRTIEEHNVRYEKGEESYFLKTNEFADWTPEEFKAMLNSQLASRPQLNFTETFEADPSFTAPASIDWRTKANIVVKNQGNCGGCWAFSTTGALEAQISIHQKKNTLLSEQELIDCDNKSQGCKGGLMTNAFDYIKSHGLSSESQYKYTARDGKCQKVNNKPLSKISGYVNVARTEAALASAVASIGPVSIAVDADLWQFYGGGVFDKSNCGNNLNHGILAVGYTDKYWIIKNSWGTSWGEKGYIRLVRGKNQCGVNLMNSYPKL